MNRVLDPNLKSSAGSPEESLGESLVDTATRSRSGSVLEAILAVIFFAVMGCLYLWPAPMEVLAGKTMGYQWDDISLPYFYWWISELSRISFPALLNGAIYSPNLGYPSGSVLWIAYSERIMPLMPFVSPESASMWYMLFQYILSGFLSYLVGRKIGLDIILSLALGVCVTFTPYTYWRSMMHMSLAGVYVIPATVLAFLYLRDFKSWRGLLAGSGMLLLTLTSAHYLILVVLTLLPFLFFVLIWKSSWSRRGLLVLAFIPFLLGLVWIKKGLVIGLEPIQNERILFKSPLPARRAWDVLVYSARATDYLTGNYNFDIWDWNPLRRYLTERIFDAEKDDFYPQERSSGVRWHLLLGLILFFIYRRKIPLGYRRGIFLGGIVLIVTYVFSLSPRAISPLGIGVMPSRWLHELVPQMRCPNRWSIGVQMGISMIGFLVFAFLISKLKSRRRRVAAVLALLVFSILDFPPTLAIPTYMSAESVKRPDDCGVGAFLPYSDPMGVVTASQYVRLRSTNCKTINHQQSYVFKYYKDVFSKETLFDKPFDDLSWVGARKSLDCLSIHWISLEDQYRKNGKLICSQLGYNKFTDGEFCDEPEVPRKANLTESDWRSCVPAEFFEAAEKQ